jgi:hypothetical protein
MMTVTSALASLPLPMIYRMNVSKDSIHWNIWELPPTLNIGAMRDPRLKLLAANCGEGYEHDINQNQPQLRLKNTRYHDIG